MTRVESALVVHKCAVPQGLASEQQIPGVPVSRAGEGIKDACVDTEWFIRPFLSLPFPALMGSDCFNTI